MTSEKDRKLPDLQKQLIEHLECWCGCSAYGEHLPCDEHNCDDSRGRNCSADELLDEIKKYLKVFPL